MQIIKHGYLNTGRKVHAISTGTTLGNYPICLSAGAGRRPARIIFTTEALTCKWCADGAQRAEQQAAQIALAVLNQTDPELTQSVAQVARIVLEEMEQMRPNWIAPLSRQDEQHG